MGRARRKLGTRFQYEAMMLITVHIPKPYLDELDRLVDLGRFPNRSEAIRIAIRDLIHKEYAFLKAYRYFPFKKMVEGP